MSVSTIKDMKHRLEKTEQNEKKMNKQIKKIEQNMMDMDYRQK